MRLIHQDDDTALFEEAQVLRSAMEHCRVRIRYHEIYPPVPGNLESLYHERLIRHPGVGLRRSGVFQITDHALADRIIPVHPRRSVYFLAVLIEDLRDHCRPDTETSCVDDQAGIRLSRGSRGESAGNAGRLGERAFWKQ